MIYIDENAERYKKEIKELKREYSSQIDIFCGLEVEMYSDVDMSGYDFLIGSVHYLNIGGKYVGFDRDEKITRAIVNEYFGGDTLQIAKAYYETVSLLTSRGNFDIIGHFDFKAL